MPAIGRMLAAVVAVSLLGVAPPSAHAAPPPSNDVAVTLITGDVVHASHDEHGRWVLAMQPVEPTAPAQYVQFPQRHGDIVDQYLIPAAAMPLVQSGAVDRELFDVTSLIRQGRDDARSDVLPLVVDSKRIQERKADTAASWKSLAGAKQVRLDGVSASAVPKGPDAVTFDVTFAMLDRHGKTPGTGEGTSVVVINLDTGTGYFQKAGDTVSLPAGRYGVTGNVRSGLEITEVAIPELKVDRGQTVTLDASKAKQVRVSTDQPTARAGVWTSRVLNRVQPLGYFFTYVTMLDPRFSTFYATSQGPASAAFAYADNFSLVQPDLEFWVGRSQRFEVPANWLYGSPQPTGTGKFDAVLGGAGTPDELSKVDVKGKLVVVVLPDSTPMGEAIQRIANVKAAGGAAVAVTPSVGRQSFRADVPIELPVFVVSGDNAQRLVAAAKAGGLTTEYTARTASRYRYELSFPSEGRIPANLVHKVGRADLAAVTTSYYGPAEEGTPGVTASVDALGTQIGTVGPILAGPTQAERVEYFTPGNWHLNASYGGDLSADIAFAPGKSYTVDWNKAVAAPSLAGTVSDELGPNHARVWRSGSMLDVSIPVLADAAGHPRDWPDQSYSVDTGTTSLYREGQLVGTQNAPGRGVFVTTLLDRAQYRLTTEDTRDQPWWPMSTKVSAAWTFRPTGNPVMPLLDVQFAPAVDLRDIAPGGGDYSFPVTVVRQDGPATISQRSVDVSYDDGTTWQAASVSGSTVTVHHPANGFASLRATAVDQDGNSVELTVIRAYRIGG
jgi:hypothetical protein